jgi:hypothetical protein
MEAAWVQMRARRQVGCRNLREMHSNEDLPWRLMLDFMPHCCVCCCSCCRVPQVLRCVCNCEVLQYTVCQDAFMHLQVMAGICSFCLLLLLPLNELKHWVPFWSQLILWGVGDLHSTTAAVLLSITK